MAEKSIRKEPPVKKLTTKEKKAKKNAKLAAKATANAPKPKGG